MVTRDEEGKFKIKMCNFLSADELGGPACDRTDRIEITKRGGRWRSGEIQVGGLKTLLGNVGAGGTPKPYSKSVRETGV